jgi:hypothetical protein
LRTRTDLESAFALLERAADAYQEAADEIVLAPGDPTASSVLSPRLPQRANRRKVALSLGVAALVSAVVVGANLLVSWPGGSHGGAGDPGPTATANPLTPSSLALPFALDPASGMQIIDVQVSTPTHQKVDLVNRTGLLMLNIYSADGPQLADGLQPVDINGKPGLYSDGSKLAQIVPSPATASASPSPTVSANPPRGAETIAWRYTPTSLAVLSVQGPQLAKIDLLMVARSMNFGATTTLRSAISVNAAPAGMRLVGYGVTYQILGENPPYDRKSAGWATSFTYRPGTGDNGISIGVTSVGAQVTAANGEPVTVAGHQGYYSAQRHLLTVDLGDGVYLSIAEAPNAWNSPLTMTREQLMAVFPNITLTAHLDQPDTWFDAAASHG